ncbi:hypothetical protein [Flagellimonas sp. 2504JD4-2]
MKITNMTSVLILLVTPGLFGQWSPPASETDFITSQHTSATNDFGLNLESDGNYRYVIENNLNGVNRQAFYFGHSNGSKNVFGIGTSGNSGSSWSPRFVVNQDGKVGIGVSSPDANLHVHGSSAGLGNALASIMLGKTNGPEIQAIQESADDDVQGLAFRVKSSAAYANANYEAMRISKSGNLGIGTSDPLSKVHIYNGASGQNPHSYSDITIEDDDHVMLSLMTYNTKNGYYGFADTNDGFVGGIQYNHATDVMHFRVNNHASDMTINASGDVGIGTTTPDSKLAVNGNIHAKEVKVDLIGWPDYVFNENHNLPTLDEVEKHIQEKGHLINIPSAKEVEENGIQLGEMNKLLLEKIEELTLYTLQQQKQLALQKEKNKSLEERLARLEKLLEPK